MNTVVHTLLQYTLNLFDTFLFIHSKQQHPVKAWEEMLLCKYCNYSWNKELWDIYSKAAHSHNLYCISHIFTHIYIHTCWQSFCFQQSLNYWEKIALTWIFLTAWDIYTRVYIYVHAKNILRWQWSLVTEQFTGSIYFFYTLLERKFQYFTVFQ